MNPVAPWMHDRPIRNRNPGDLRPRHSAPPWPGQEAVDTAPGGPFSIFTTNAEGWCCLALWCLDARYIRGLQTARSMVAVFAPESENDTKSYSASVAAKMGDDALDLSDAKTLETLCRAIAHYEEWHNIWTDAEIASGMSLAALKWPEFRAVRLGTPPPLPATETV